MCIRDRLFRCGHDFGDESTLDAALDREHERSKKYQLQAATLQGRIYRSTPGCRLGSVDYLCFGMAGMVSTAWTYCKARTLTLVCNTNHNILLTCRKYHSGLLGPE